MGICIFFEVFIIVFCGGGKRVINYEIEFLFIKYKKSWCVDLYVLVLWRLNENCLMVCVLVIGIFNDFVVELIVKCCEYILLNCFLYWFYVVVSIGDYYNVGVEWEGRIKGVSLIGDLGFSFFKN